MPLGARQTRTAVDMPDAFGADRGHAPTSPTVPLAVWLVALGYVRTMPDGAPFRFRNQP